MALVADFMIFGLPNTINAIGRKHWTVKHREAKTWKRLVFEQCVYLKINGLKLQKARLEFVRYSAKEPDFDNLASSFKHVMDGLVMCEVIEDDRPSIIGSPKFSWIKTMPKDGKIRVRIFSVDEP